MRPTRRRPGGAAPARRGPGGPGPRPPGPSGGQRLQLVAAALGQPASGPAPRGQEAHRPQDRRAERPPGPPAPALAPRARAARHRTFGRYVADLRADVVALLE